MPQSSFPLARRAPSHAIGIVGAIVVHALFLQAISLGASTAKRSPPPEETGPGASAILSRGEWMTLVIVQLPAASPLQRLEEVASRGLASNNETIRIVSPDPTPAFEVADSENADDSAEATQTVGDPAVQSILFGRYTGQISARINRSWRRPRSAVSADLEAADTFRCQARITQDTVGNVKEIELISCGGTVAWQQSLVNAIQGASPLPAPPNPTVFTQVLTLMFEAHAYMPDSPEGDYEPQAYRLASESSSATTPPDPRVDTAVQTDVTLDSGTAIAPLE